MRAYIENLTERVDQSLLTGVNPGAGILDSAIHYALSVKGKRLRPLLFLTLVEAFGYDPLAFMDIASAIEYIHTYSLIHDDLPAMDNDDFRRGMPTVHKKFNEPIALLAGDTLLTMAFERLSWADIKPARLVNILRLLTAGIGKQGMAWGQVLDLEFRGDKDLIMEIHRRKTAEFIKAVFLSAAEIGELGEIERNRLGEAGITIGVAFQLVDDLLDIEGDEAEVGKKLKKDEGNRSPNAVLFFGRDAIKKEIDDSYRKARQLIGQAGIDFSPFLYLVERMVFRSK